MAQANNTGSTVTLPNGQNKTSTALSTNILILVNNQPVGAIQTLSVKEDRQIKMIGEVGTSFFIDSAPQSQVNITGSCTRVRFDKLRMLEAFGRGYIHIGSQAYPFDIVILDRQKAAQAAQISTVIKNVWISNLDYSYSFNDWIITEQMSWHAETIYSVLNGGTSGIGGVPVAVGGEIGIKHMGIGTNGVLNLQSGNGVTNIEQLADTGSMGYHGALDASGLIDLGDSGNLF